MFIKRLSPSGALLATFLAALCLTSSGTAQGFEFAPGDIYASGADSLSISRYSSTGALKDTLNLAPSLGEETRGLAFGPNGLLYTVISQWSGFGVYGIDAAGHVQETYEGNHIGFGNMSHGKIAFGSNSKFYVAGQDSLYEYTRGNPNGTEIFTTNQVFDVEVLPTGNLLVLSAYDLTEITPSGSVVRVINPSTWLGDARGLAYDALTNSIYVTMLGYTGAEFQLLKLNGDTGHVDANRRFWYGDDIVLTADRQLVVGSRTQAPGIFDLDLNLIGQTDGPTHMFVTTMAVPEPSFGFAILLSGYALRKRLKRRTK